MIWDFFLTEKPRIMLCTSSLKNSRDQGQVNSWPSSGSQAAVWGAVYSRVQNNFLQTAMHYWHYWHQAEFCHICLHRLRAQINSTECQGKSLTCSRATGPDYDYLLFISVYQAGRHTTLCNWVLVIKPSRSVQDKQEDHRYPLQEIFL